MVRQEIAQNFLNLNFVFKLSGYSQKVCLECKTNAIIAFKFRQTCISTDECIRLNRKPTIMNNEHDYSLYINDDYDMDLSEYLIDTKETAQDLLLEESETVEQPLVQQLDDTQNFDAPVERKKNRRYTCPVCNRLWVTPSKLERHMSVHRNSKSSAKEVPSFTTPEPIDPVVQCPICFKPFESPTILNEHMKSHQRVIETTHTIPKAEKIGSIYVCSVCSSSFTSPAKLQSHMKSQHMRKISYTKKGNGVKSHEKINTGKKRSSNTCSTCQKSFPHPSKLARHLKTHKKVEKEKVQATSRRYECSLCSKKFETPSKLLRHQMSSVHRDILTVKQENDETETPPVLEISAVTSILGD